MSVESITVEAANYHRGGEYDAAIKCHLRAVALLEDSRGSDEGHCFATAEQYRSMGAVMEDAGNFEKAMVYYETAVNMFGSLKSDIKAKIAKGEICELIGNMLYKKEDYADAIEKLSAAQSILKDTGGCESRLAEVEYLMEMAEMMQ